MKNITIETERLILTPKSIEEMRNLCETESNPEMREAYSAMLKTMLKLNGREEWGSDWKISVKSGPTIGGICFKGAPDEDGAVEIGYGIDEVYRQKGYATEAVGGVARWALSQENVRCVTAQTEEENFISQKVLLKNGFIRDGFGSEGPLFKRGKDSTAGK